LALEEVITASMDNELALAWQANKIKMVRLPENKPRKTNERPRPVKVELPTPEMRAKLLALLRAKRHSLTAEMHHSYARNDYTIEQMKLDMELRKRAGNMNKDAKQLKYIVRDLEICTLRNPRELPRVGEQKNDEPVPMEHTSTADVTTLVGSTQQQA
jgi:hypothetical protein